MEVDSYPDAFMSPVDVNKYFSTLSLLRHNFANGVRDKHHWTSVCMKSPRNPVSRAERVSVIVCFVLSAMASCVLLYLFHFGFLIDEDKPSFYLDSTDTLIFFLTLTFASSIAHLIMELFSISLTHKYQVFTKPSIRMNRVIRMSMRFPQELLQIDELQPVRNSNNQLSSLDENNTVRKKGASKSRFRRCGVRIKTILRKACQGNSLLPVRQAGAKSDLIVRKPWFIIAWLLWGLAIFISVLIILLYAWKLPTTKDNKFLTTYLVVVLIDVFLLSFIKVLLFSVILTFTSKNTLPGTAYNINKNDGKRLHLAGDRSFLHRLVQTRKHKIYYPLRESEKASKRVTKIRIYRWKTLCEFVMMAIFIVVISFIFNIYYVGGTYMSNSHATRMMTTSELIDSSQVLNRTHFNDFLVFTYTNRLFRYMWYNYEPLNPLSTRKDWTNDCVSRLLGNTRIRQLRVSLEDCRVSGYFNDSINFCAPSWSMGVEDTDVYATSWRIADEKDKERRMTTWRFTKAEYSNSSRFYGESGTLYHDGGYIAELGYSKNEVRSSVLTLEKEGWLDHMTRAVFVECTLYNGNTDLFTQVVLVSEQHPTGQYISIPKVESITINRGFDFWSMGFVVFLVFFLIRAVYFINRRGVLLYLSTVLGSYDLFLLVLGFTTAIIYAINMQNFSSYVEEFQRKGLNNFFSFFKIVRLDYSSKAMMCFLFGLVVLRCLLFWRFGRIYFSFYFTLLFSRSWIIWLTLYFITWLIVLWRFVGYKINAYIFSRYSFPLVHPKTFKMTGTHDRGLEQLIVYLMCTLSSFVLLLFTTSFAYFYRRGRSFSPPNFTDVDNFNYFNFLKREFQIITGIGVAERKEHIFSG